MQYLFVLIDLILTNLSIILTTQKFLRVYKTPKL